jgi:quinoprotein glucose dehydrogenase
VRSTVLPALLLLLVATTADAQRTANPAIDTAGEWRAYNRDPGGTRYSPLADIRPDNVARLTVAWRWTAAGSADAKNESTPLMIGGALYFTSGIDRAVVRADAATGATRWRYALDEGRRATVAPRRGSGRGVSYWSDGRGARIFVVTPGFHLVALDAESGEPVATFGTRGVVDLKALLGVPLDTMTAAIGNSSPPAIVGDVVIVGPALEVGLRPASRRNVPGRILAIDARTGALRWRFNTVPQAGEYGNATWQRDSWRYTGNAGAWAPMSVDAKRGWVYVPVEAATGDYYGGHRPGDNLFSTTLVCLDARTGRRVWHYQLVHHDIWDRDIPTAPILADVTVAGRRVETVVQLTKQTFAYVFDRVTGKPVWPIVERAVPASDVPGEHAAPTQPMPTRPLPYDRQEVTERELIDFTPALREEALTLARSYRLGGPFTPPSLAAAPDGTRGTLTMSGSLGGTNWEGGAFDPTTGRLFVGSHVGLSALALEHDSVRSDMDYVLANTRTPSVQGLPLVRPPYGTLTAIDLRSGARAWQVPNGETPDAIRTHPALAGLDLPNTGSPARPVMLATRTLLLTAEGYGGRPALRALDKRTGRLIASIPLPGTVSSVPMTYRWQGRQYVALWVDVTMARPGEATGAQLVALALPR